MRFLLRVLVIFVAIYAALSLVRGLLGSLTPVKTAGRTSAAGKLVKDPVCGMYIAQDGALSADGSFFCSEECRGKFNRGLSG